MGMKLGHQEREIAILLFSSVGVQAIVEFGSRKISGEPGSIAHCCGDAANAFVAQVIASKASDEVAHVALASFISSAPAFLLSANFAPFALRAIERAVLVVGYLETEN